MLSEENRRMADGSGYLTFILDFNAFDELFFLLFFLKRKKLYFNKFMGIKGFIDCLNNGIGYSFLTNQHHRLKAVSKPS